MRTLLLGGIAALSFVLLQALPADAASVETVIAAVAGAPDELAQLAARDPNTMSIVVDRVQADNEQALKVMEEQNIAAINAAQQAVSATPRLNETLTAAGVPIASVLAITVDDTQITVHVR